MSPWRTHAAAGPSSEEEPHAATGSRWTSSPRLRGRSDADGDWPALAPSPGLRERQQDRRHAQSRRALAAAKTDTALASQPGPSAARVRINGEPFLRTTHSRAAAHQQRLLAHTFSSRGSRLGRGFNPPMWRRARGGLLVRARRRGPAPLAGCVFRLIVKACFLARPHPRVCCPAVMRGNCCVGESPGPGCVGFAGCFQSPGLPSLFPATRMPACHSRVCRFISTLHGIMHPQPLHTTQYTRHGPRHTPPWRPARGALHPGWGGGYRRNGKTHHGLRVLLPQSRVGCEPWRRNKGNPPSTAWCPQFCPLSPSPRHPRCRSWGSALRPV